MPSHLSHPLTLSWLQAWNGYTLVASAPKAISTAMAAAPNGIFVCFSTVFWAPVSSMNLLATPTSNFHPLQLKSLWAHLTTPWRTLLLCCICYHQMKAIFCCTVVVRLSQTLMLKSKSMKLLALRLSLFYLWSAMSCSQACATALHSTPLLCVCIYTYIHKIFAFIMHSCS